VRDLLADGPTHAFARNFSTPPTFQPGETFQTRKRNVAFKAIIPALFTAALCLTPATAMTPAKNLAEAANASVITVQHHRGKGIQRGGLHRGGMHQGRRYVPGRRYGSPPAGWRHYGARPGDWRTRGCILVGPLWFCP
jgi:hypothetical protein